VQQHSRCLHHIIAHTPNTDKHPVCTALTATKSLHKYGVCHPHYWCCILGRINQKSTIVINCKSSR